MCTRKQWKQCETSEAYYAANKFAIELEEYAKINGYNYKGIKIRTKEQIIKDGLGKADAQVVWEDGPKNWALDLVLTTDLYVSTVAEAKDTVSFYLK